MKSSFLSDLKNKKILKGIDLAIKKISTDTRSISKGDFYLPLKGENFDGEKFISNAIEQGAIGFLTTDLAIAESYLADERVQIIAVVPDTKLAYMELAAARIKKNGYKVVGITGSSGKTTTKELIFSVVSQDFKTHKTSKNHNNEIGFCQTVFEAPCGTEVLILEMGMRGLGEIELIAQFANPDIAVITNVGTAHIGRLGSRENIALAKCEIAKFLKQDGVFVSKEDDLIKKTVLFSGKKVYYSLADVNIVSEEIAKTVFKYKDYEYILPIEGRHNIENSLAAINVGLALGMSCKDISKGLFSYKTIENRWNIIDTDWCKIINDSYNANPESMKATIDTVLNLYPKAVLILGDMGELGEDSISLHNAVGQFINEHCKLQKETLVLTVGEMAKEISSSITNCRTLNFRENKSVSEYILKNKNIGNILFFKASRSMRFEEIIAQIKGDV